MSEEFKSFVNEYISMCDKVLVNNDYHGAEELQSQIISTFKNSIKDIDFGLDVMHFYDNEDKVVDYISNIKKLKDKLKVLLYTSNGNSDKTNTNQDKTNTNQDKTIVVNNHNIVKDSGNSTNTNTNTNTVTNTFDIKVELDKIRKEIEEDEMLDDDSKKEIHAKLDEVQAVIDENPSNNERWKKLKPIMNWVTTKGFGVAKKIAPFLIKAIFHES